MEKSRKNIAARKAFKVGCAAFLTFVVMIAGIIGGLSVTYWGLPNFDNTISVYNPSDFVDVYFSGANGQAEIFVYVSQYEIERQIGSTGSQFSKGAQFKNYLESLEYIYDGIKIPYDYDLRPVIFNLKNDDMIDIDIVIPTDAVNVEKFELTTNKLTAKVDYLADFITDVSEVTPTMVKYHYKMLMESEYCFSRDEEVIYKGTLLGIFYKVEDTILGANVKGYDTGATSMIYVFTYENRVAFIGETNLYKPREETKWEGTYLNENRLEFNSNELSPEAIFDALAARGFLEYDDIDLEAFKITLF